MYTDADLPDDDLERAEMLQAIAVARATGEGADDRAYKELRRALLEEVSIKPLLPVFVRTCRDLGQFWSYIKGKFDTYQERREHIWSEFRPVFDHLEGRNKAPADFEVSEVLATFDTEGTHAAWEKALARRHTDPDGAITAARALLEIVCKRILDEDAVEYDENAELPALYHLTAEHLNLAPSQHTEKVFKAILGNCQQVVNNLGSIRNKIGDAHGRGGRPVRPAPRHAALAVNLAGAVATFLVETWQSRR